MTDLLRSHLDFIYFVYGLGFILLLPICLYLHRRPRILLPWMWLLLFGATHGLLEWLDMVALSLGTDPVFDVVRLGLLILSFLLLAEFGRAGLVRLRGRGPGRWVLAVLLGLALLGAFAGLPAVRASARYALALVGALGAAAALWLAAHRAAPGRGALQGAALCLAGYAAAAGLVVDPAPFFPASWLNTEVFLAAAGVPIQLGRGFLAAGLSACLALFAVASLGQEKHPRLQKWGRNLMAGTVVSVLVLVIAGWFVTQYLGRAPARETRDQQEHHNQVLQFVLKMAEADQLVAALAGSPGIVSYLASRTPQNRDQAHAVMDRYSTSLPGAIMYVMDREGLTIASSNRLAPNSFLGESYAFRPYFRQALQGARGSYWALGVTSGELGYYASFPVRDGRDEIIGVAVIKRSIRDLEGLFPQEVPTMIIDAHGVVVMANRPGMHLKSLWPLSAAVREQLIASRQFGPGPFAPILAQAPVDGGDCRFQGRPYLVLRQPLPFQDWSIVILTSPRPIAVARLLGLSVTILSCLVVLSLLTIIGLTIESTSRVQRSENRFRQLYGNLRDGTAIVDMSGNIGEWNPAFQAMLGYPPEELIQLSLRDLTPETWQEQEARIIAEQVLPRGYSNLYEQEYRRRDGSVLPVELQTYLVREDGGQPTGMWVFVRDLTERKRAEEALRESEEKYRLVFEKAPLGIMHYDQTSTITACNEKFAEIIGAPREKFIGFNMMRQLRDEKMREAVAASLKGEVGYYEGDYLSVSAGKITPIRAVYQPVFSSDGVLSEGVAIFEDIIERKRAEETLRESEEKYRLLVNQIPAVVFQGYGDWSVDFFDNKIEILSGYTKEEFGSRKNKWCDLILPEDLNNSHRIFIEALKTDKSYVREYRIRRKDGAIRWIQGRGEIFCDAAGKVDHITGVFFDITERKQAEEAFRVLVNYAPIGIFIVQDGKFQMVNPGFEQVTGYTAGELLGSDSRAPVHPDYREAVRQNAIAMLKGELDSAYEFPIITKGGETRWIMEKVTSTTYLGKRATLGYFLDITERKSLEDQFLQAQKMEAVGLLAGGIAHDLNNILMAILGNIGLAVLDDKIGPRGQDRLAQAEQACWRAQALSQQLLTFAKGGAPIKKLFSVAEILTESTAFACVGSPVKCKTTFPENLWSIEADPGQIGQVFQNLTINAIQAMPTGGTIKVWAENLTLGTESDLPLSAGRYIKISVRDQGMGIPAEHLPRIFDPYFTTKQKGSGLGLASAYAIIKKHHGHIAVESKTGEGTTFHIYLPAVERQVTPQPEEDRELLVGKGKVLVMDDEEMVREVLGKMLARLGYEATCAGDGDEAIERFVQAHGSGPAFAAVILDLTVPGGMGGKETIARLLEIDPQVKAVVSSGYSDDPIMADFQKYGFSGVITKPYRIIELSKILQEVVTGKP